MSERGFLRSIGGLFLLVLSSACFGTCGPSGPPEPTACSGSVDNEATVDEIRLGRRTPFHLLEEDDATEIVRGDQGSDMMVTHLAWRGGDDPECGRVRIRLVDPETGHELASREAEVTSFPAEEGGVEWRSGSDFYFIIDYASWGPRIRIEAEAFGRTTDVLVFLGGWPPPDAGWDAGMDAGRDAGMDAGQIPFDAGNDAGPDAGNDAGPVPP